MADKKISQLPAATLPLAGTELLPIVQSGTTDNITVNNLAAGNIKSNATTGVLQVTGPADASTRVMTTPDANFTIARTDTGQTFTGTNIFGAATTTARTVNIGGSFAVERFGATPQIEMLGGTNSTVGYSYRISINQSNWTLTNAVIGSGQANIISIDNATKDVAISAGNLVIGTSGKGIDFSATSEGTGTMTSELLADYEEGTWTPVITNTSINATMDASTFGTYTKIGRLVTCQIYVGTTNLNGIISGFYVSGWPYAISKTGGSCASYASGLNTTAGQNVTLIPWSSDLMRFYIWDATTGTSPMNASAWTDDGAAYFTITYQV